MSRNLSPKDLALVIGVSESSLKRWVDEGRLEAARTAGGHRRIALYEAIRFIRDTNQTIVKPELLGLTDLTQGPIGVVIDGAGEAALLKALIGGKSDEARGLMMAQHIASRSFAGVCDGPISHAMHRIGEIWRHSESGIMIEHRATEIVLDAIHQIRATLPPLPDNAPVAIGASAPLDMHMLPSLMAATTLLESGYRDVNFGANLPVDSLIGAIREHKPRMVWMSLSSSESVENMLGLLPKLASAAASAGAVLVLGGRAIYGRSVAQWPSTHIVASMSELAALARGLKVEPSISTLTPSAKTNGNGLAAASYSAAASSTFSAQPLAHSATNGNGASNGNGHLHGIASTKAKPKR